MDITMTSVFSFDVQVCPQRDRETYTYNHDNDDIHALPEPLKKQCDTPPDILDRTTFLTEFDTEAYLKDFYSKVDEPAMQMVLKFLPNIVARLGKVNHVLDFGAGPTVHVAACFRHTAEKIFLADYLPQNREELQRWYDEKSNFDWTIPMRIILTQEGKDYSELNKMIPLTRKKVSGIYHCDCFCDPSVEAPKDILGTFDVIVTTFCIEYCTNTYDEYKDAVKNIARQIKPGGYLVMGGILEETWCSFGGRKFTCLYITREMMITALAEAGLALTDQRTTVLFEINGMFLICAQKRF